MSPFGTRGRAQDLADLLDDALSGRVSDSTALAASLSSYAAIASRLQAVGSASTVAVAPRAEFRDALRTRLMAVAAVQAHSAPARESADRRAGKLAAVSWTPSRTAQRRVGVAAGAMASVVAVTGIAVAGSQSLPGDPFYNVKKGAEALELRTADGPVDKGSKHLEFAEARLSEVKALSLGRDAALGPISTDPSSVSAASAFGGSAARRVRDALADMDTQTRQGSTLLTAAYRQSQAEAPLQILARFAGRQSADLRTLLPDLPAAARSRAEQSLSLVSQVGAETSQLLAIGVCTGLCNPTAAAPALPPTGVAPQPAPQASADQATTAPCGCAPAPASSAPAATASAEPTPQPSASTTPTPGPTPSSSSTPSPEPSSSLPVPLPVPVPSLPVPSDLPIPGASALPVPVPTGLPVPKSGPGLTSGTGLLPGAASGLSALAPGFAPDGPVLTSLTAVDVARAILWRAGGPADPAAL